jgi:hypothetical protein
MKALDRLVLVVTGAIFGLILIPCVANVEQASAQESNSQTSAGDIVVSVSVSDVSAMTGQTFTFTSEITNLGSVATPPLTAGLNFTSLDQSTYVDPEDWSPNRTVTVAPIEPGASDTRSWTINPILEGDIAAYIVILPNSADMTTRPLIASPAIHLHVSSQRSLNPGGVLPVVLAVPGVLALALAGLTVSSKRQRS